VENSKKRIRELELGQQVKAGSIEAKLSETAAGNNCQTLGRKPSA
jgi:hypothetical protein